MVALPQPFTAQTATVFDFAAERQRLRGSAPVPPSVVPDPEPPCGWGDTCRMGFGDCSLCKT